MIMMNWKQRVASRCKECRENVNLTLAEVAKRTGLTEQQLSKFENGTEVPAYHDWAALAKAYQLRTIEMIRGLY